MNFPRSIFLGLSLISTLACAEQQSTTATSGAAENTSKLETIVSLADKQICGAIEEVVRTVAPALVCEMRFAIPGESENYRWDELSKDEALLFFRQLTLRHDVSHIDDPEEADRAIESIYQIYAGALQSNNVALFRTHVDLDLDGKNEPLIKLDKKDLHRCTDGPDQNGPARFIYDVSSPAYAGRISSDPNISHGRLTLTGGVPYFISWYDFPESLVVTRAKFYSGSPNGEVRFTRICSYSFKIERQ